MSGFLKLFKKKTPTNAEESPQEKSVYDRLYEIAEGEIGVVEYTGSKHHPKIIQYFLSTSYHATTDETPWCAAFVGWVINQAGLKGSGRADAVSYLRWGKKLSQPVKGCVMVLEHPNGGHHVTFYSYEKDGYYYGLGGNQANAVNVSRWKKSELMKDGFRGPA